MQLRTLLTITLAAIVGCSGEPPAASVAITHVTVIDGSEGAPLNDVTVLISGNRIRSVSHDAPPDGATIIDGTGKYLIPGLWDMHMHVSLLRGPDILPVFLGWGITGVRDMGSPDSIFAWRDQIAEGTRVGPRIVSAGLAFVNQEPGDITPTSWGRGIMSAANAAEAVNHLAAKADYLKIQDSFMARDVWFALARQAAARNLKVAGHVPFGLTLEEAIDSGLTSIEHTLGLAPAFTTREAELRSRVMAASAADRYPALFAADAEAVGEIDDARVQAIAALMIKRGVALDANLKDLESEAFATSGRWNNDRRLNGLAPELVKEWRDGAARDFSPASLTNLQKTFAAMPALIARLHGLGVMVVAGTDAGAMFDFPGSDLHHELELLVEGGLTPLQALQTATVNPARYMGFADSLGVVRDGFVADLVLLDADPLQNISNTRRIHAVVRDGRIYDRAQLQAMVERK